MGTIIKPSDKTGMLNLLNALVGSEEQTKASDLKIKTLMAELTKEKRTRETIEVEYMQDTLNGIASLFEADEVPYPGINKYMLDCMKLTTDNWAFKASNGAPVSVSAIKNWKNTKDEELKAVYCEVAKGDMFQRLNRFEAIKGRKFTQGKGGFAVLKKVQDEEGKVVENPAIKVATSTTTSTSTSSTTDTPQVGDAAGFASKSGILTGIISLLDQIEASSVKLDNTLILRHIAKAQELLIEETGTTDDELSLD